MDTLGLSLHREFYDIYYPLPGDQILVETEAKGLWGKVKVWALGSKYDHIITFDDWTQRAIPLIIESIGRGVLIRSLSAYYGRKVLVMRHLNYRAAMKAAIRGEGIANKPQAFYDYYCIVRFMILRLIWFKLTGQRRAFGYNRNEVFICSELSDEEYEGIASDVFGPPLPGDFAVLPQFLRSWEGSLGFFTVGRMSPEALKLLSDIRGQMIKELQ